jgi:hypothetical protein
VLIRVGLALEGPEAIFIARRSLRDSRMTIPGRRASLPNRAPLHASFLKPMLRRCTSNQSNFGSSSVQLASYLIPLRFWLSGLSDSDAGREPPPLQGREALLLFRTQRARYAAKAVCATTEEPVPTFEASLLSAAEIASSFSKFGTGRQCEWFERAMICADGIGCDVLTAISPRT